MNWYCVQTKPREEDLASIFANYAGFESYLPIVPTPEPHGRSQWRIAIRPVFSGYVFVRCEPDPSQWQRVLAVRSVKRFLGSGTPASISQEAIDAVRLFEAEEYVRLRVPTAPKQLWTFAPGQVVRIKQGPFAGFYAQLKTSVDKKDRVIALIRLLGADRDAELSAYDIQAADSKQSHR